MRVVGLQAGVGAGCIYLPSYVVQLNVLGFLPARQGYGVHTLCTQYALVSLAHALNTGPLCVCALQAGCSNPWSACAVRAVLAKARACAGRVPHLTLASAAAAASADTD